MCRFRNIIKYTISVKIKAVKVKPIAKNYETNYSFFANTIKKKVKEIFSMIPNSIQ